jgi:hypothetical protein
MEQNIRSAFLEREVQLATVYGYEIVDIWRGSGHLLLKDSCQPDLTTVVAYEIVIRLHPERKIADAVGSMLGSHDMLQQAMMIGGASLSYSPGRAVDVQLTQLESGSAYFKVLGRIGI